MSCWLGVVTNMKLVNSIQDKSWWCMPPEAIPGDIIYLYCPASTSRKHHGVFAKAVVGSAPSDNEPMNAHCRAHSNQIYGIMLYVEIEVVEKYGGRVSAKEIKADAVLGRSILVRRNFQGTSFLLSLKESDRLKILIDRKSD